MADGQDGTGAVWVKKNGRGPGSLGLRSFIGPDWKGDNSRGPGIGIGNGRYDFEWDGLLAGLFKDACRPTPQVKAASHLRGGRTSSEKGSEARSIPSALIYWNGTGMSGPSRVTKTASCVRISARAVVKRIIQNISPALLVIALAHCFLIEQEARHLLRSGIENRRLFLLKSNKRCPGFTGIPFLWRA